MWYVITGVLYEGYSVKEFSSEKEARVAFELACGENNCGDTFKVTLIEGTVKESREFETM